MTLLVNFKRWNLFFWASSSCLNPSCSRRSSTSCDSSSSEARHQVHWYIEGVRVCRKAFLRVLGLSAQRLSRTKKTSGGKTCEALRCSVSTFNKFFLCQACRHNDQWSRALIPVLISEDIWGPCKSKRLRCKLLRADLLEHCRDLASWPQPCPRWVWLLPITSQRAYELRHCLGKRLVLRTDANSKNKHRSTIFVVDIGVIWRLSLSMSD